MASEQLQFRKDAQTISKIIIKSRLFRIAERIGDLRIRTTNKRNFRRKGKHSITKEPQTSKGRLPRIRIRPAGAYKGLLGCHLVEPSESENGRKRITGGSGGGGGASYAVLYLYAAALFPT